MHLIHTIGICTGGGQGYDLAAKGLNAFITGEVSEQTITRHENKAYTSSCRSPRHRTLRCPSSRRMARQNLQTNRI